MNAGPTLCLAPLASHGVTCLHPHTVLALLLDGPREGQAELRCIERPLYALSNA